MAALSPRGRVRRRRTTARTGARGRVACRRGRAAPADGSARDGAGRARAAGDRLALAALRWPHGRQLLTGVTGSGGARRERGRGRWRGGLRRQRSAPHPICGAIRSAHVGGATRRGGPTRVAPSAVRLDAVAVVRRAARAGCGPCGGAHARARVGEQAGGRAARRRCPTATPTSAAMPCAASAGLVEQRDRRSAAPPQPPATSRSRRRRRAAGSARPSARAIDQRRRRRARRASTAASTKEKTWNALRLRWQVRLAVCGRYDARSAVPGQQHRHEQQRPPRVRRQALLGVERAPSRSGAPSARAPRPARARRSRRVAVGVVGSPGSSLGAACRPVAPTGAGIAQRCSVIEPGRREVAGQVGGAEPIV